MNPAPTVPSIADVDPDVVVAGDEDSTEPRLRAVVAEPHAPSLAAEEVVAETPAAAEADTDEMPLDYVADYDDDQTSGVDDDMVDQRIPFT